jgi:transcriptional regulator with XRE-family HTH domain
MAPVKKPKADLGPTYFKQWREHRKVGQQNAADAINVSRTLLSKIENSESPYLQQYVEGLAAFYRCRPSDLIGTDPTAMPRSPDEQLRAALLSYGIDRRQLDLAVGIIGKFLQGAEPPEQTPPDDRFQPASRRREEEPSQR